MTTRRFAQVDVFSGVPVGGNPVAVVLDADGITDDEMASFARWTNLSETTFVLPSDDPAADYRLRIFTPAGELPFAGHPTLGSAHAWLEAGGSAGGGSTDGGSTDGGRIVQECGVGLVPIRTERGRLSFAAPPRVRSGPVDEETVQSVADALGLDRAEVVAAEWVANGPDWMALLLASGDRVLEVEPDMAALGMHEVGLIGPYSGGLPGEPGVLFEVRAFAPGYGIAEDPVTGSLNAGLAVWLRQDGRAPAAYVAAQGGALGRSGRVHVADDGTDIWVGGVATTVIAGTVVL
ncbi:PhzF family phenazine biosynthesis isomerase [Gordonia sp. HNM0687]|uniref:PhzF family phenazine biosynthesis isomerase n=1 Tax=Gordonia mangrovi TaxID=2665643 RepID=A0A6L7GWK5_9ACTN|nr:PhzF family phenazine biosynthesis protein [Gordonia mangrovi]MXP22888.1 PhzF family phenazine biosynthesis isomerase [Gordonia mangrovi]UVF77193.1 PhzF family phenazine biosynthesis protein [Gordonia mangrovi]